MTASPPTSSPRAADFFVLRAPQLPFDVLTAWGADLAAPAAADEALGDALAADRALLLDRLRAEVSRPAFREAVLCASPTLDEALSLWLRDPASPRAAGVTPILVRYLTRMAGRCTPFGLFSSCGVGPVGGEPTTLTLAGASLRRHTRLDMQYLTGLVEALERDAGVRAALRYQPSSGLYRVGAELRYAEAEMRGTPPARAFRLVSLEASPHLEAVLAAARAGATPGGLAAAIVRADPEIDAATARDFVDQMIDGQVLVSELTPPLTGPEPIHHVIAVLRARGVAPEAARVLEGVRDALLALDEAGVGQGDARYRAIADSLRTLPAPVEPSRLFQIDLIRGAERSRLGPEVVAALDRAVALLRRIALPIDGGELGAFAAAFRERYEGREVPMCEALDDELGVGFGKSSTVPSDLLEGLQFPAGVEDPKVRWGARHAWIARRLLELERDGASRWELDEADLAALETRVPAPSPDSFAVMAVVSTPSAERLAAGDFEVLVHGSGAGGATMLGRFCHADPTMADAVVGHLRAEEELQPDVVLAEIVHQPEGRIGNILCRPVQRAYEIPYLASSGVDAEHRIDIEDLLVSVGPDGQVRLRSRRLGRWVQPRMTNAHNAATISLSIYRFLCALRGDQGRAAATWHWGPLEDAPHLPRVCAGRVVLALEQWTLGKRDLADLAAAKGEVARHRALRALRARLELPRWVALLEGGDHVLPIDLDNALSCESFLDLVKGREAARLLEVFPAPGRQATEGDDGRHVSELVVPYLEARAPTPALAVPAPCTAPRSFAPGSDWLYAKVYAGWATADALLRDAIAPVVRAAFESAAADRWFFIRYADPHPHLRVRLHGAPERLLGEVLPALHRALAPDVARGLVHSVTIDTYVRETERYGGDRGIEPSEAIFHADSDAVLALVERFDGATDAAVRWRLALAGMDRLLDDLGHDPDSRLALMRVIRDGFATEHHVDTRFERALGARFRAVRGEVELLLDPATAPPPELAPGLAQLAARSRALAGAAGELRALAARGQLGVPLASLAASLLHMHANRLLAADHRAQELVLYDFLLRVYESRAARTRRGPRA